MGGDPAPEVRMAVDMARARRCGEARADGAEGALLRPQTLFRKARDGPTKVVPSVCSDAAAVRACVRFAADHQVRKNTLAGVRCTPHSTPA